MSDSKTTSPKALSVFLGPPGAGKSKRFIELVNAAHTAKLPAVTFACNELPWMRERDSVARQRILGSRQPGLTCKLDHFVSTAEAIEILSSLEPGTLAAFEEAHYFSPEIAGAWLAAAARGVEVLACMPSAPQRDRLRGQPRAETHFLTPCEQCKTGDATTFIIVPGQDATKSLCEPCRQKLTADARRQIVERLQSQAPYPGERTIYQPVEIPECDGWNVLRPDSKRRVEIMTGIFRELDLLAEIKAGGMSYLDVGCNTGFFCHHLRQLGFHCEGEDVVAVDIELAQMMDSFLWRDRNVFVAQDAYDYLRDSQARRFDVTSAFAIFQWLMIQTNAPRGIDCLQWLFAKTRRVCFIEMGYSAEAQYQDKLPINIDRAWVENLMHEKGGFAEVRVFPAGEKYGVSRDLFVGIKPGVKAGK